MPFTPHKSKLIRLTTITSRQHRSCWKCTSLFSPTDTSHRIRSNFQSQHQPGRRDLPPSPQPAKTVSGAVCTAVFPAELCSVIIITNSFVLTLTLGEVSIQGVSYARVTYSGITTRLANPLGKRKHPSPPQILTTLGAKELLAPVTLMQLPSTLIPLSKTGKAAPRCLDSAISHKHKSPYKGKRQRGRVQQGQSYHLQVTQLRCLRGLNFGRGGLPEPSQADTHQKCHLGSMTLSC